MEHETVTAEFRKRALDGDGQFAIAFALMRLREDLCFGDGSGERQQGPLEVIARAASDMADILAERS